MRTVTALAAAVLVGVGFSTPAVAAGQPAPCEQVRECLLDRTWQLAVEGTTIGPVAAHGTLSLRLRATAVSPSRWSATFADGCNGMGANLELNEEQRLFAFEYFHSTPRFCDDVSNAAENALAGAIGRSTVSFDVTPTTLVLHTERGDLAFRVDTCPPPLSATR